MVFARSGEMAHVTGSWETGPGRNNSDIGVPPAQQCVIPLIRIDRPTIVRWAMSEIQLSTEALPMMPNAPLSGAGVRSTEASAPTAG
jgi:hypothetical protein